MKKAFYLLFFAFHFSVIAISCISSLGAYQEEPVIDQLNKPAHHVLKQLKPFVKKTMSILPKPARYYAFFTGTNSGFGFFSPNIPTAWTVYFELKKTDGSSTLTKALWKTRLGRERVNTSMNWFRNHEVIQPIVAQSWGVRVFEMAGPSVSIVEVINGMYVLPSMKEYREGARLRFHERKRFAFKKKA
ncbi:MAG: hypothetical protein AAF990_15110 [Bacteroidota bacterium]